MSIQLNQANQQLVATVVGASYAWFTSTNGTTWTSTGATTSTLALSAVGPSPFVKLVETVTGTVTETLAQLIGPSPSQTYADFNFPTGGLAPVLIAVSGSPEDTLNISLPEGTRSIVVTESGSVKKFELRVGSAAAAEVIARADGGFNVKVGGTTKTVYGFEFLGLPDGTDIPLVLDQSVALRNGAAVVGTDVAGTPWADTLPLNLDASVGALASTWVDEAGAKVLRTTMAAGNAVVATLTTLTSGSDYDAGFRQKLVVSSVAGATGEQTYFLRDVEQIQLKSSNGSSVLSQYLIPLRSEVTGHYYDTIVTQSTWTQNELTAGTWDSAKQNAEALTYRGLRGYLVTITSEDEQKAVESIVNLRMSTNSYIQGLGIDPRTGVDLRGGHLYTGGSDRDQEGFFKWMSGPELNQPISYSKYFLNPYDPSIEDAIVVIYAPNLPYQNTWANAPDGSISTTYTMAEVIKGYIVEYGGLPASYTITPNTTTVFEGGSVTFTIDTTNVEWGTSITYTLSGISPADVSSGSLSGTAVVQPNGVDGRATVVVSLALDNVTEATESLRLSVGSAVSRIVSVQDPDSVPPSFVGAATSGDGALVVLTYSEPLSTTSALSGAFTVRVDGATRNVTSAAASASTVQLTLASPVTTGQSVTVAYADPTIGNDINAVQDVAGNDALSLNQASVTPGATDSTSPTFSSAETSVDGFTVKLTYSEPLRVTTAAASNFTVTADTVQKTVSSVSVSGSTVQLTLASAVASGQKVTVSYADPTTGNDTNAVQDVAGNDAASLPAVSVMNNVADITPPTFLSATLSADLTKVNLNYSETLNTNTAMASAFAVMVNDAPRSVSLVSVSGSTVQLTLASAVASGQTVTVAYTDPSGSNDASAVQDLAGNDAATLSPTNVSNPTAQAPTVQIDSAKINGTAVINLSLLAEGNTVEVTLSRTGTSLSQTSTVNWSLGGLGNDSSAGVASASDFSAASGTVTFAANAETATFSFTVNDDSSTEPVESFNINLTAGTNAALLANSMQLPASIAASDGGRVIDVEFNDSFMIDGDRIEIRVQFDGNGVMVNPSAGAPTFDFKIGTNTYSANYAGPGYGWNDIRFVYNLSGAEHGAVSLIGINTGGASISGNLGVPVDTNIGLLGNVADGFIYARGYTANGTDLPAANVANNAFLLTDPTKLGMPITSSMLEGSRDLLVLTVNGGPNDRLIAKPYLLTSGYAGQELYLLSGTQETKLATLAFTGTGDAATYTLTTAAAAGLTAVTNKSLAGIEHFGITIGSPIMSANPNGMDHVEGMLFNLKSLTLSESPRANAQARLGTIQSDKISVAALTTPGSVIISGDAGNDSITGHSGQDFIDGGPGDDSIDAGGGNDQIDSSSGVDTVKGGADFDVFNLGGDQYLRAAIAADGSVRLQSRSVAGVADVFSIQRGSSSYTVTDLTAATGTSVTTLSDVELVRTWSSMGEINLAPRTEGNGDGQSLLGTPWGDMLTVYASANGFDMSRVQGQGGVDMVVVDFGAGATFTSGVTTPSGYTVTVTPSGGTAMTFKAGFSNSGGQQLTLMGTGFEKSLFLEDVEAIQLKSGTNISNVPSFAAIREANEMGTPSGATGLSERVAYLKSTDTAQGGIRTLAAAADSISARLIGVDDAPDSTIIDKLVGNVGNDILSGRGGRNELDGGAGNDTVDYSFASQSVSVSLFQLAEQQTGVSQDKIKNIEAIVGSRFADDLKGSGRSNGLDGGDGDDMLDGGRGNDQLWGRGGDDVLNGGRGNDTLEGGKGADTLVGGAGADTFVFGSDVLNDPYESSVDRIEDFNPLTDRIQLSAAVAGVTPLVFYDAASGRLYADVTGGTSGSVLQNPKLIATLTPGLTLSSSNFMGANLGSGLGVVGADNKPDVLTGSAGADRIDGLGGDDTLQGGLGADSIYGGSGTDRIRYSSPAELNGDVISGGAQGSTAADPTTDDRIQLMQAGTWDFAQAASVSYIDRVDVVANIPGTSPGTFAITLTGAMASTADQNRDGVLGDIRIVGYDYGGNGPTTTPVSVDGSALTASQSLQVFGQDGSGVTGADAFGGLRGNDTLLGGAGADTLNGGGGSDALTGGGGNDSITGGGGNDVLTGGAGADRFVFDVSSGANDTSVDQITDFAVAEDKITLNGGTNALIGYDPVTGGLFVDPDGSAGSLRARKIATLAPGLTLTSTQIEGATLAKDLTVVDGYVAGAQVFFDANSNGMMDTGEPSAYTGDGGVVLLSVPTGATTGQWVVRGGGVDTYTGETLLASMVAPLAASVVTPLTTLIAKDNLVTTAMLAKVFGVTVPGGVNLNSFDAVAAMASTDAPTRSAGVGIFTVQQTMMTVMQMAKALEGALTTTPALNLNIAGGIAARIKALDGMPPTDGYSVASSTKAITDTVVLAATKGYIANYDAAFPTTDANNPITKFITQYNARYDPDLNDRTIAVNMMADQIAPLIANPINSVIGLTTSRLMDWASSPGDAAKERLAKLTVSVAQDEVMDVVVRIVKLVEAGDLDNATSLSQAYSVTPSTNDLDLGDLIARYANYASVIDAKTGTPVSDTAGSNLIGIDLVGAQITLGSDPAPDTVVLKTRASTDTTTTATITGFDLDTDGAGPDTGDVIDLGPLLRQFGYGYAPQKASEGVTAGDNQWQMSFNNTTKELSVSFDKNPANGTTDLIATKIVLSGLTGIPGMEQINVNPYWLV